MRTAKAQAIAALVTSAASVGFEYGNSRAIARAKLAEARSTLSQSDFVDYCLRFKAGRIVSYFENPPKAARIHCTQYVQRRWDNLPFDQRVEAALEIIGKAAPTAEKPNRRIETEHKAARAADTALSELKRDLGWTKTKAPKKRSPRPAANDSDAAPSFTVASPKLPDRDVAIDFFNNAMAALVATTEINSQPGAAKGAKGVAFAVQSILVEAKAQVAKALAALNA